MEAIIDSIQRLLLSLSFWRWGLVLGLLVACIALGRTGYFLLFVGLAAFAWVLDDLTEKTLIDASYNWPFTFVILVGLFYAIYSIFHRIIRSGH